MDETSCAPAQQSAGCNTADRRDRSLRAAAGTPRDPEVLDARRAAEPWSDRAREAEPAAWAPRGGRVPAAESPFGTSQDRAWRQITPFHVSRSVGDLGHGRAGRTTRTILWIRQPAGALRELGEAAHGNHADLPRVRGDPAHLAGIPPP